MPEVEPEPERETNRKSLGEGQANGRIVVTVVERIVPTGATKTAAVSRPTSYSQRFLIPAVALQLRGFSLGYARFTPFFFA